MWLPVKMGLTPLLYRQKIEVISLELSGVLSPGSCVFFSTLPHSAQTLVSLRSVRLPSCFSCLPLRYSLETASRAWTGATAGFALFLPFSQGSQPHTAHCPMSETVASHILSHFLVCFLFVCFVFCFNGGRAIPIAVNHSWAGVEYLTAT